MKADLNRIHRGDEKRATENRPIGTLSIGGRQMAQVIIASCRPGDSGPHRVQPRGFRRALASSTFAVELSDGPAEKDIKKQERARSI
jgi:hypothetical protein